MSRLTGALWTAFILLFAIIAAVPARAQSQATTGVIEGIVLDESGALIPGATVTFKNTATNFERVVSTDTDGRFRGLLLPLGPYRVTVAMSGFATLVREGLNLAVGQAVNLSLILKVSSVQEQLVVTAEVGRSSGGFVNVVTKSGTNDVHGTAHAYFKSDSLSAAPKRSDGSDAPKTDFSQQQLGFTLGGPLKKDKAFYFVAFDYQNGSSTKQTDPARIEPRVVDYFASLGSANENGSIDRTNDARVLLTKVDW